MLRFQGKNTSNPVLRNNFYMPTMSKQMNCSSPLPIKEENFEHVHIAPLDTEHTLFWRKASKFCFC